MEKVGNPVPARLLYLLIVVREFLEEFVFSIKTPSETITVIVVISGVDETWGRG